VGVGDPPLFCVNSGGRGREVNLPFRSFPKKGGCFPHFVQFVFHVNPQTLSEGGTWGFFCPGPGPGGGTQTFLWGGPKKCVCNGGGGCLGSCGRSRGCPFLKGGGDRSPGGGWGGICVVYWGGFLWAALVFPKPFRLGKTPGLWPPPLTIPEFPPSHRVGGV